MSIADTDQLLEAIGRPDWLTDLVIERLGLDNLLERAYSRGVADGRAQRADEDRMAVDIARDRAYAIAVEQGETDETAGLVAELVGTRVATGEAPDIAVTRALARLR